MINKIKQELFNLIESIRFNYWENCPKHALKLDGLKVSWGIQNQIAYLGQYTDLYANTIIELTLKGYSLDDFVQRFKLEGI